MEFSESNPIYQQIADHFCEQILLDRWREDDKIPSVREIAVLMEVNPNTAMRAFTYLQEKGIIYNKRGIGYFVAPQGKEKALALKRTDFIEKEAPVFFRSMKMLGINLQELEKMYKKQDHEKK